MEVEIKAKIDNLEEIKNKLKDISASLENPKQQSDIYFMSKERDPGYFRLGDFILRIRNCEKGKFLTYKEITERRGVWKEYETKIDNIEDTDLILKSIGLREVFRINKERTSGKAGEFSFNIDNVKELGKFIEVELISDDGEKAQKKIKDFFHRLGIKDGQLERRGYGELWQIAHGGGIKVDEQV